MADAEWEAARGLALETARFREGVRILERKKRVFKWFVNRSDEEKEMERKAGYRRSGEVWPPKGQNLVGEITEMAEKSKESEQSTVAEEKSTESGKKEKLVL